MNLMATVDNNWIIGNQGQQIVSVPEGQRLMRAETLGKVLVMSRRTLEHFPGKQPLYGRTHIILTKDEEYTAKGAVVCRSLQETLEELANYEDEDIFIIGGQSIYEQFLPYCDTAHITAVDYEYNGDRYCPNLEADPQWKMTDESDEQTYFNLCYTFRKYEKIPV